VNPDEAFIAKGDPGNCSKKWGLASTRPIFIPPAHHPALLLIFAA